MKKTPPKPKKPVQIMLHQTLDSEDGFQDRNEHWTHYAIEERATPSRELVLIVTKVDRDSHTKREVPGNATRHVIASERVAEFILANGKPVQ